jgi:hypothetical protein
MQFPSFQQKLLHDFTGVLDACEIPAEHCSAGKDQTFA